MKEGDSREVAQILTRGPLQLDQSLDQMDNSSFIGFKAFCLKQKNMERILEHTIALDPMILALEVMLNCLFPQRS